MLSSYGAKMPRTSWEQMASFEIPLLSLEEQRRIADFLDERVALIDQIIAARAGEAGAISARQLVLLDAIIREAGQRYGVVPLRRLCDGIEQGASPITEDRLPRNGEAGVLKTSAISGGTFRPGESKATRVEALAPGDEVRTGDMLVTRGSGSAALVGDAAVAVVPPDARLFLPDLIYRVRAPRISPQFAVMAVLSPQGRAHLGAQVRQGSGPAKARGEDILSIPVPHAPPGEEFPFVERYAQLVAATNSGQDAIARSLRLLQEYKQSLITAAVTGELDVTTASTRIPENLA